MQKIVLVGPLGQSDSVKCSFVVHMKLLTHFEVVQTKLKWESLLSVDDALGSIVPVD